jgi:phytanoyl-CoA hydroxylase
MKNSKESNTVKPPLNEIRENFERDGFAIVPNLFIRDEAAEFKKEMQRVIAEVKQEALQAGEDPEQMLRTGVYVGLAARSDFYHRAVGDERIVNILEALLGPNIEFLSDKAVFKNAETEFGSPWHQDWPYWQGAHKISLWVALDDATPENGCMKFIPGSHRTMAVHDGDTSDGLGFTHRLDSEAVDESTAVTTPLEAGGAVFFHDLTLHASYPNTARKDRWVWIPTYRDAQADDPPYSWAVAATVLRGSGHS